MDESRIKKGERRENVRGKMRKKRNGVDRFSD